MDFIGPAGVVLLIAFVLPIGRRFIHNSGRETGHLADKAEFVSKREARLGEKSTPRGEYFLQRRGLKAVPADLPSGGRDYAERAGVTGRVREEGRERGIRTGG